MSEAPPPANVVLQISKGTIDINLILARINAWTCEEITKEETHGQAR